MSKADFTRPTTDCWQALQPPPASPAPPPWRYTCPVALPDGSVLELPIRALPQAAGRAVASLIANQASFEVIRALSVFMAVLARPLQAEVVVGLPTLGMSFAQAVAEALGHSRYVPMGYSRKFWYDEALSAPVRSLTTPGEGKRIYIDPNQAPLLRGRRVVVVDDAISSGSTVQAVLPLLTAQGALVAGVVVAMLQGSAWRSALGAQAGLVHGVFESPRLALQDDGWVPVEN